MQGIKITLLRVSFLFFFFFFGGGGGTGIGIQGFAGTKFKCSTT
jgi:hypothetical protein